VPTVHLDSQYHNQVLAYAATSGATATFTPDNTSAYTPPTPIVAGFSSRGPVLADGSDIIKPDISAPGVAIIADGANAAGGTPTFEFLSGTSMAAPHISGLGLLYLGVHPTASPSEIKSALMTTAYDTKDGTGKAVTDPFTQGAGHADPTKFFAPGLLYLNGVDDWNGYIQGIGYDVGATPIDPSNLNLASIAIGSLTGSETITRTVTARQAGTFTAKVAVAGVDAVVSPSTLTFAAGESKSFTVAFNRTTAPLDAFTTGSLTWTSGSTTVRSPIAVKPVTIVAPASAKGTGTYGSVDITVTPGGDGDIPLSTTGLTAGILQPDPTPGGAPGHSGSSAEGSTFNYTVDVPKGSQYARFDLDTTDNTADLDLVVYRLDAAGTPIAAFQSATGSADERVNLLAPDAGSYLVEVTVYAAPVATTFDLRTYAVAKKGATLTLTPPVLPGKQAVPATYTAAWAGLAPYSNYLGLVNYGATGAYTVVNVVTQADVKPGTPLNTAPPTITGTAEVGETLIATPGTWNVAGLRFAYRWQANGVNIPGATRANYRVGTADQGKALTVVVTTKKSTLPSGTATSAPVTVKFASAKRLSLSSTMLFPGR
jgi:hypothetical protein